MVTARCLLSVDGVPVPDLLPLLLQQLLKVTPDSQRRTCQACTIPDAVADPRLKYVKRGSHAASEPQHTLVAAASRGHTACVRALVANHAAAPNAPNAMGQLALTVAVEADEPETVAALLELGADPRAASPEGSPLDVAKRGGERLAPVAALLLQLPVGLPTPGRLSLLDSDDDEPDGGAPTGDSDDDAGSRAEDGDGSGPAAPVRLAFDDVDAAV